MLYAIIATDHEGTLDKRLATRPDHIERLKNLTGQGRLILAGPLPAIDAEDPGEAGFTGSLIVAEFDSLKDARLWAEDDPYAHAGVYQRLEVKPFKYVLP